MDLLKILRQEIYSNPNLDGIRNKEISFEGDKFLFSFQDTHYSVHQLIDGNYTSNFKLKSKFGYTRNLKLAFAYCNENQKCEESYYYNSLDTEEKYFQYLTTRDIPYSYEEIIELFRYIKLLINSNKSRESK